MRRTKNLPDLETLCASIRYDANTGHFYKIGSDDRCENNSGAGYFGLSIAGRQYLAHRIAWKLIYGTDPRGEVDHINGNRIDNSARNLRIVSSSQNNQNRRMSRRNSSGVKGVCWEASRKRWRATVGGNNGELIFCKRFKKLDDAKHAVEVAREQFCGVFANHGI